MMAKSPNTSARSWMILNPRELEAVRSAVRTAAGSADEETRAFWSSIQTQLRGDELEITQSQLERLNQWARSWTSAYEKSAKAILSALMRHC